MKNAARNIRRILLIRLRLHPNYRWGKLVASFKGFEAYWKEIGYDQEILPVEAGLSLQHQLSGLRVLLTLMLDGTEREVGWDFLVLKLNLALAAYGSAERNERYSPINSKLHQPLRDFLNYSLLHRFKPNFLIHSTASTWVTCGNIADLRRMRSLTRTK